MVQGIGMQAAYIGQPRATAAGQLAAEAPARRRRQDTPIGIAGLVTGLSIGGLAGATLGHRLVGLPGTRGNRLTLGLVGASLLGMTGGIVGRIIDSHRRDASAAPTTTTPQPRPYDDAAPFGRESDNPRPTIPTAASTERIPETVTGVSGSGQKDVVPPFNVRVLASGLAGPVHVTSAPGDGAMYVVEAGGTIKRFSGSGEPTTFVDLTPLVGSGGERGLLSVAFHPDYARNGRVFVNYTDTAGDTHVGELQARNGVADPNTLRDVMVIDQPYGNHNGGQLQFGPDGYLYIGMGDGGSGGDPQNRSQDPSDLLGKMLRIDVNSSSNGKPYGIPADNPFADGRGGQPEIYALGVRNPWRFSFDRSTGDLWIGDVGQGRWEEVNFLPRGTGAGANLGWDVREGASIYEDKQPGPGRLVDPALQYSHDEGAAVTGGFVYRGMRIPELQGYYVYSDYATDSIRALKVEDGKVVDRREYSTGERGIVSFGEGPDGELYATTISGKLLQIGALESTEPTTAPSVDTGEPTPVGQRRADVQYVPLSTTTDGSMRFDRDVVRVRPGKVEIDFTNADFMPHNVAVSVNGVMVRTSRFAMEGESQRVEFEAKPGDVYEFWCDPHVGGGMKGRIVVDPA